jgi:hypothetical protein
MKKRILVVEDEEKLRRVIELQLVSGGFDVDKAATAEEALKVVDRADLVLTDLQAAFHGRPGIPRRHPPPERARPGDHDDRVRQRGDRGGSHEGRRHRFSAQAVRRSIT